MRLTCVSVREELECAAKWARARLEAAYAKIGQELVSGNANRYPLYPRIGIVVPDLEQRRNEVMRIFSRVMEPGWNLPGAVLRVPSFNISLGAPLADYPLVHAALGILDLAHGETDFPLASRLIRSPFLAGSDTEMTRRARLDAVLRELAPPRLTLPKLLGVIGTAGVSCPILAQKLHALFALARQNPSANRSPQDWGRHFTALLESAGFPGARTLDTNEFQTHAKFYGMLGDFAGLERVAPRLTCAQALVRLRRLCADTLFQPESGAAPIQVLGILESAGLEFDYLWASGLTDEAWPLAVRPHPFIPPALQKKAGVPQASADTSLTLDKRITEGWLVAAEEVILSHPLREKDRDLAPSPFITAIPAGKPATLVAPDYPRYRDMLHAARALESIPDGAAPALAVKTVRGGTRVLADQAACPFRAFARHRLGAQPLKAPAPGLDAADRGTLIHALLAHIWGEVRTRTALDSIAPGKLDEIIRQSAAAAVAAVRARRPGVLEGHFAELEAERLAKLAREWLEVERQRPDFEVVAREDTRTLEVAGLALRGRIDRMDKLVGNENGGGHVLIDYKTGQASVAGWLGERPEDPQLPFYATNAGEDIAAIAFAKLKAGAMKFDGLARAEKLVPGAVIIGKSRAKLAKRYASWHELVAGWKQELAALGAGFAAGDARVDPKHLLKTCERCDLQPLCRVHERYSALAEEENGGDE